MINAKLVADKYKNSAIVFKNGDFILGKSCGSYGQRALELCFSTAMTGYQEAITDPSYGGQAIVFSFVHIGNTGINKEDLESGTAYAKGIIINNYPSEPSNWRSENTFSNWLKNENVIAICDIDTRALVQKIRSEGMQSIGIGSYKDGEVIDLEHLQDLANNYSYNFQDIMNGILSDTKRNEAIKKIERESENESKQDTAQKKILVLDYGVKLNILGCIKNSGFSLEVLSCNTNIKDIDFAKYNGIVLSNGPADPNEALELNKDLVYGCFTSCLPILGICLGHQIIGIAHEKIKMKAFKMHQGHRGTNHPVKNLRTGTVEITSQNHGYALKVEEGSLSDKYVSHRSLFDHTIAGLYLEDEKIITTQYHPESSAGTHDSRYIFEEFRKMIDCS